MPPDIRNPILLMLAHTIGLSIPRLTFEHVQQGRQVHGDEARLGVVAVTHVVGEDPERLVDTQAQEQVDDDVLHPDDRGPQSRNIAISASMSRWPCPRCPWWPSSVRPGSRR